MQVVDDFYQSASLLVMLRLRYLKGLTNEREPHRITKHVQRTSKLP